MNPDCRSRADCRNGRLVWDNTHTCKANAVCKQRGGVWQCFSDDVDCFDVYEDDKSRPSGVYTIKPTNWPGLHFQVYCNMNDGGGWTVSKVLSTFNSKLLKEQKFVRQAHLISYF